tara:strand:+ start:476 stop:1627 length:1152 start_codon:yes stop_codon:yes gene_type:complete
LIHVLLANKHFLGITGGAERNISDLANWLSRSGFKVTVVSESKHGTSPAFPLDAYVDVIDPSDESYSHHLVDHLAIRFVGDPEGEEWLLSSADIRKRWGTCIRRIDPDVILTFMPHTSTFILQELADEYPILVTNQNDPSIEYYSDKHGSSTFEKCLRLESLARANLVHFLIPGFVDKMPDYVKERAIVIPNAVQSAGQFRISQREKRIIGIGRLVPQKGFDQLIAAFAQTKAISNGWQLHIFGNGGERDHLLEQIRRLKAQRSILLRGHTSRPQIEMARSQIFVIPSVYEGWGLTLTEAMSVGLPSIGFVDCSGVNWLIHDNENGLLVERGASELADAIDDLVGNETQRIQMGERAQSFTQQFAPEMIYSQWVDAVKSMVRA